MEVENVHPAGDAQGPAATESKVETAGQQETQNDEPIRNEAFLNKVLHEKKNAVERLRKLEDENKSLREEELKRQENYKLLAEEKDKELTELRSKYNEREKLIVDSSKLSAVKKELTKLGCDAKYLDKAIKFVNLDNLQYDHDTGVVAGTMEAAKAVQEELPPFFGNTGVGVNQSAPAGAPSELTLEGWKKLPYEERKKRQNELYTNLGITRK